MSIAGMNLQQNCFQLVLKCVFTAQKGWMIEQKLAVVLIQLLGLLGFFGGFSSFVVAELPEMLISKGACILMFRSTLALPEEE